MKKYNLVLVYCDETYAPFLYLALGKSWQGNPIIYRIAEKFNYHSALFNLRGNIL
jgi:hypothetical protein